MIEEEDIDGLAAEYVLGSLSPDERAAARKRYMGDARFDDAVSDWERRLMPLSHREPGMEPPPQVLESILTQIAQEQVEQADRSDNVVALRGRLKRWQWATGALATAAAALAIVLSTTLLQPGTPHPDATIAILAGGANNTADEPAISTSPVFLARYEPQSNQLGVRQIAGRFASAPRAYTLWIKTGRKYAGPSAGSAVKRECRKTI